MTERRLAHHASSRSVSLWAALAVTAAWLATSWVVLTSDRTEIQALILCLPASLAASVLTCVLLRAHAPELSGANLSLLVRAGGRATVAAVLTALATLAWTAGVVLGGFPNSGDEYAYALQAQTYAAGRLWVESPVLPDAFRLARFLSKDGIWVSQYQPGWALLMSPAAALGLPLWLVNPLIGTALLFAFFRLAAGYVSREMSWVATLTLGTSAFFLLNLGSFFSHGATALAAVLSALCVARYLRHGGWRWAVLAGVLAGCIGFTRILNAVVLLVPITTAMLLTPGRRLGVLALAAGGAPFLLAVLAYNEAITGNPLLFVPNWFKPGGETFGVFGVHTIMLTIDRVLRLGEWTSPILVAAAPAAFLLLAARGRLAFVDWLAPTTVLAFLFYAGSGGDQYGPRYYFEAWPFALLTIARAVDPLLAGDRSNPRSAWVAAAALSILAAQLAYLPGRLAREHRVVFERQEPFRLVRQAGLTNAVVLVGEAGAGHLRPMPPPDLVRNGLDVRLPSVVYAWDLPERYQDLRSLFPGREFYRYRPGRLESVQVP